MTIKIKTGGEWVDVSQSGTVGITVEDEGVALSTAATTLDFVGNGVVASGTTATKTITIDGGGMDTNATTADVLTIDGAILSADNPSGTDDKIVFWDESETKLTHLTVGSGLNITGNTITATSDAGKTYTLEGVDSGSNAILRLSDGTTDDDVTITAGSGITLDPVAAGGFTISANSSAGKTYTLEGVDSGSNAILRLSDGSTNDDITITAGSGITLDPVAAGGFTISADSGGISNVIVKQYSDNEATRTERTCNAPIDVVVATGTATIGIGSTSNAYGERYTQDNDPTTSDGGSHTVCDGDLWYDTSASSGSSGGSGTIPVGGIILWSGTIAAIPTNWALCNGSNSTPDLRNTFVIGAHSDDSGAKTTVTGSATQSGGSKNAVLIAHEHKAPTYNGAGGSYEPGYQHPTTGYDYGAQAPPSEKTAIDANGTTTTGSSATQTGTNANLPPYYALAYIMRTS